jgi:hypothetical protein
MLYNDDYYEILKTGLQFQEGPFGMRLPHSKL